jgi:general stress protein 26
VPVPACVVASSAAGVELARRHGGHLAPALAVGLTATELREVAAALAPLRVGMVTTAGADGGLHTRPMAHRGFDAADGALWFFTRSDAGKVAELATDQHVAIAYADPRRRRYLALTGHGRLLRDADRARRLWRWAEREWFPRGPDDPQLLLLRVAIDAAEDWRPAPTAVARLAGWLSGRVRGRPARLGTHRRWGEPPA